MQNTRIVRRWGSERCEAVSVQSMSTCCVKYFFSSDLLERGTRGPCVDAPEPRSCAAVATTGSVECGAR
jgi:hypothetical protein